MDRITLITC